MLTLIKKILIKQTQKGVQLSDDHSLQYAKISLNISLLAGFILVPILFTWCLAHNFIGPSLSLGLFEFVSLILILKTSKTNFKILRIIHFISAIILISYSSLAFGYGHGVELSFILLNIATTNYFQNKRRFAVGIFTTLLATIIFSINIYLIKDTIDSNDLITEKVFNLLNFSSTCLFAFVSLLKLQQNYEELFKKMTERDRDQMFISLGNLAGGLAHEVNNPLAIIQSSLSLLENNQIPDALKDKTLKRAEVAVHRIKNINDRLLHLVRYSKETEEPSKFSSTELITDIENLDVLKDFKDFKFIMENKPPELILRTYRNWLLKATSSILKTALQESAQHPDPWIKVQISSQADFCIIRVASSKPTNNTPKNSVHTFQQFHPFHTAHELGKGMGLELATTKSILIGLDGKVQVLENEIFSTYEIIFPVNLSKGNASLADVSGSEESA